MLMVLVHDDSPAGATLWSALKVDGHGRSFTREQVEAVAAQTEHESRFLFPYTEQSADFGRDEAPRTLAMPPGDTIWHYGEPARVDMLAVLRAAAGAPLPGGSVPSPDPSKMALPVATVVAIAMERFGRVDAHNVEVAFDTLVIDLGGTRHDEPPYYGVPLSALGVK